MPWPVSFVDDTGLPKKGTHSVGVARQYCGQTGKQDNCQVAVSLSVATWTASLPVAYRLYLPEPWANDSLRRKQARIPNDIAFQTKLEIALGQIRQAIADEIPQGTVLADPAYGNDTGFRQQGWFWSSPPAHSRACSPTGPHRSRQRRPPHGATTGACAGRSPEPAAPPSARPTCPHRQATAQCSTALTEQYDPRALRLRSDGQGSSSAVAAGRLGFPTWRSCRQTTTMKANKYRNSLRVVPTYNIVVLASVLSRRAQHS
jgi:hypothetical protein